MKISDIKPNPNNPRTIHNDKFKKLVQSLKEFPEMAEVREVVINKDHVILGGNMRFKAMQEAGWTEIPVKVVDWSEDKQREFIIKDNVSGGEWDWDLIANEWDSQLLDDWGLDMPVVEEDQEVEEDEAPEVSSEPPVSQLGVVYQLGRHRVMCGDSTDKENVDLLMDGDKADMVFTDPPYGVDYDGGVIHGNKINKDHKREKLQNDQVDIYQHFIPLLKDYVNGAVYIFYATRYSNEIFKALKDNEIDVMAIITWVKTNTGYADMNSHYKNRYEPFVYCKIGDSTNFIGSTAENTTWEMDKDRINKEHPTQKPIEVCARAIKNHKGNTVLDLFLGSGSTLIACEQTDRTCYGMELDPKYVDVIRKRYAKFIQPDNQLPDNWEELTPAIN